jgi:CubicO group peptidase (beta-lactamase class C family)
MLWPLPDLQGALMIPAELSRRAALAGLLTLGPALPSFAQAPAPPTPPAPKTAGMSADQFAAHIRAQLAEGGPVDKTLADMAAAEAMSGAVLVALDGKPLFRKAYGFADKAAGRRNTPETRFAISSCNKMFTATVIGRLLERGRLKLQDRLSDHLPDMPRESASRVTLAQLLSHTAGFGSYMGHPDYARAKAAARTVADYMALVRDEPLQFEPGSRYAYSNSGYVMLGAVIERLTGRDYFEVVADEVYRPGGMRSTGHFALDDRTPGKAVGYTNGCFARPNCTSTDWTDATGIWGVRGTPAGGGYSTVDDLLRFANALKAGRLLKPATRDLFIARHVAMDRTGGPIDGYGYGFGDKLVKGLRTIGHNGGTPGATAQLDMFETRPLTLVVLTNYDGAQRPVSALLRRELT